jgi:hypothetical protein
MSIMGKGLMAAQIAYMSASGIYIVNIAAKRTRLKYNDIK